MKISCGDLDCNGLIITEIEVFGACHVIAGALEDTWPIIHNSGVFCCCMRLRIFRCHFFDSPSLETAFDECHSNISPRFGLFSPCIFLSALLSAAFRAGQCYPLDPASRKTRKVLEMPHNSDIHMANNGEGYHLYSAVNGVAFFANLLDSIC